MEFNLLPAFDPEMECLSLLAAFVNDGNEPCLPCPPAKLRAHYARIFSLSSGQADACFGPLEAVYDAVVARLPFPREALARDFVLLPGTRVSPAQMVLHIERMLRRVPAGAAVSRRDLLAQLILAFFDAVPDDQLSCVAQGDLGAALMRCDLSDAVKWSIYEFSLQYDERRDGVMNRLAQVKPLFCEHSALLNPLLSRFSKQLDAAFRQAGGARAYLESLGLKLDADAITAQPTAFTPTSIGLVSDAFFAQELGFSESLLLCVGVLFCAMGEAEASRDPVETLCAPLKALSDRRRLQILFMLAKGPLYAQEIVRSTGLTGATVSHHMSELLNEELVDIQKEGVRFRYTLRRDRVQALLAALQRELG